MDITYNNKYDYNESSYLTFTEIPNILKISDSIDGTRARIEISLDGNLQSQVNHDGQFYVMIMGETVTSVMAPANANNKRFYISSDEDSTAYSMCLALRNCSSLSARFNIIHEASYIYMVAKEIGSINELDSPNAFVTNISTTYLNKTITNGTASSDLYDSKITVDVYRDSTAHTDYITTLTKNFYGEECGVDVSPVLATFSEYGKTIPYILDISMTRGSGQYVGDWSHLGSASGYTTIGYSVNGSDKMLEMVDVRMLLDDDNVIRYVYGNTIPYSLLIGKNIGGWSYSVSCKDSAFNEIYNSGTQTDRKTSDSYIVDREITIPQSVYASTYYVDITFGTNTYRFNVIKPLKATEYYQRVVWRNEYGGLQFFDFTASRSESSTIDTETYEKNIFDFHETDEYEKKKIYKNGFDKTVKLTSHLMEADGRYVFDSLMKSKKVWTFIDDKKYYIIPKSVEVNEDGTYDNIYKATLTYTYSFN